MRFTFSVILSFALFAVIVNSDNVERIRRVHRTQGEDHSIQSEVTGAIAPDQHDAEFWERELGKNGSNGNSKSKSHSKGSKGKGGSKGGSKSGSKSGGSKGGSKHSSKSKRKGGSKKHRVLREAAAAPKISTFMQEYGMVNEQEDVDFWDRELRKNGSNGKGKRKGSSKKSKKNNSKKSNSGSSRCGGDKHHMAKKCKETCDDKMKWSNSKNGKIYASVKYCGFYRKYSCKGQYNCKDKKAYCRADCHKYFL